MGYNMMDNMVDNVFVSILGFNFPLLAETSLFCLAYIFFSICSCTIFFKCEMLARYFFGFYLPPPPIKNQLVRP